MGFPDIFYKHNAKKKKVWSIKKPEAPRPPSESELIASDAAKYRIHVYNERFKLGLAG
jgi:hypothetical protein